MFGVLRTLAKFLPNHFGVTVVVTSCSRHDLLDRTLSSFFQFNTFPIANFIVVEDGVKIAEQLANKFEFLRIKWLSTGRRVGQIAAIDYAYSRVDTSFIFHMEDDWEFYKSGFIEKSMQILRLHSDCLQVWIRATDDTNDHPLEPRVYKELGISWKKLTFNYHSGKFHGFSFNPGLRRFSDYIATNGYGSIESFDFKLPLKAEIAIGRFFKDKGMFAAILLDNGGNGYVRHTGDDRKTPRPSEQAL